MFEWMSLRMRYRMVYDGWHATPEDHGHNRGLGAAYRRGRGVVCLERARLWGFCNLGDDITLRRSVSSGWTWVTCRPRKPAPGVIVRRVRGLGIHLTRHHQLRSPARSGSWADQLLLLLHLSL